MDIHIVNTEGAVKNIHMYIRCLISQHTTAVGAWSTQCTKANEQLRTN